MIMTREEFDILIDKSRQSYSGSWNTNVNKNGEFPIIKAPSIGRCRYCGRRTHGLFVYFDNNQSVIMDVVARLMRKSNSVCNLDCLYNFVVDRTPEILEEITR